MGTGKGRLLGAHGWDVRITDITKAFLQVSGKQYLMVKSTYADTDTEVSRLCMSIRRGCPVCQAFPILSLSLLYLPLLRTIRAKRLFLPYFSSLDHS